MTSTITTSYSSTAATTGFPPSPATPPSPVAPVVDTLFDIVTVALILCFLLLSLLSLSFILHLRFKSRHSSKLQSFSSHWTTRSLLTILITLWSINEFFRLPILRKSYFFTNQTQFCKFHLILSFGLFEPGFLITLLFLVNLSIKKKSPNNLWAIGFVGITCLPLLVALYFAVYILPGKFSNLPPVFYRSSVLLSDKRSRDGVVYCTYPLLSGAIFAVFGMVYMFVLLVSSWKLISLAINKRLRARVNTLAVTVLVCLSLQIVMLMGSVFLEPQDAWYSAFVLVNFVCVLTCGVVGEGILVIKPIMDALCVADGPIEGGIGLVGPGEGPV